jgi:hypothetical protein
MAVFKARTGRRKRRRKERRKGGRKGRRKANFHFHEWIVLPRQAKRWGMSGSLFLVRAASLRTAARIWPGCFFFPLLISGLLPSPFPPFPPLPSVDRKEEIVRAIATHPVVIIEGESTLGGRGVEDGDAFLNESFFDLRVSV